MSSLVNTEGRLYVLVHSHRAKALVMAEPIPELHTLDWTAVTRHIPVVHSTDWPRSYDDLHPWLHDMLGNECRNRGHRKVMRNGVYTEFGGLVRLGYTGDLQREPESGRPIILGCFDTPLMDIDAVEVEDGKIVSLIELKAERERTTSFQKGVMKNARDAGLPYRVVRKHHRAKVSEQSPEEEK